MLTPVLNSPVWVIFKSSSSTSHTQCCISLCVLHADLQEDVLMGAEQ